jgi:hypothetical protein
MIMSKKRIEAALRQYFQYCQTHCPDDIGLLEHNQNPDPDLTLHIESCAHCRHRLAEIKEIEKLAAEFAIKEGPGGSGDPEMDQKMEEFLQQMLLQPAKST